MLPCREKPITIISERGVEYATNSNLLSVLIGGESNISVAQDLLSSAGSLSAISHMTEAELTAFPGIGAVTASRIFSALELGRRMLAESVPDNPTISSPDDSYQIVRPLLDDREQEHLVVVCLNARNRVLAVKTLYVGSLDSSIIRLAEVFRVAIKENAASLIIAHNHPSGDPRPSVADIEITRDLRRLGKDLKIDVLDHIIVGKNRFLSLRDAGLGGFAF